MTSNHLKYIVMWMFLNIPMCAGEIAVFIWDNFKRNYVEWAAYDVIRRHVIYKGYFTITVH